MKNLVIILVIIFILWLLFGKNKVIKEIAPEYEAGYNNPDSPKVIKNISNIPYEGKY